MSAEITEYLERLDIKNFDDIVPRRRKIIDSAEARLPKSEYNANRVARALHPMVQHLLISEIQEHGKSARSYILKAAPDTETKALAYFRAGQYLSIRLRIGGAVLSRPYSIRSAPAEALQGSYTITIKRTDDGFASNFIFDTWKAGTVIEASAPLGEFVHEPIRDATHIVGLAGGSGITPFYSLARAIADGTENATLTLLYGSRRHDEILLRDELDAIAGSCDKVRVVHILSDDPGMKGYEHGFITADLIRKCAPSDDFTVFICGPAAMYKFMEKEIAALGLPKRRVRYELFGDCVNPEKDRDYPREATGKTFQLRIDIQGHKRIVPAKSGESLLVAMERAGLAAPSLCRSGECGFCRSRLVSGSFYIPGDRDYRRMADAEYGYIHPCCTFPTSDMHIRVSGDEGEIQRKTLRQRKKSIGLIMTLIMSIVMGIVATMLARRGMPPQALTSLPPLPVMMITNILLSLSAGTLVWLIIPVGKVSGMLVSKAKAGPGTFKSTLLNCLPISLVNSVIISITVSFINISRSHARIPPAFAPPLGAMWFSSWIKMLPVMMVIAFITAMTISPLVARWVKMPGGPPKNGR